MAQGATVGFKKRKTAVKTEPSSSAASNNIAIEEQVEATPIKLESSASSISAKTTAASADHTSSLAQAATNPPPPPTAASAPPGPIVMKIGNMNAAGGAKRKFRVREPSP